MGTPQDALPGAGLDRPPPSAVFTGADRRLGAPTATYLYEDAQGRLFYQCRYEKKSDPTEGEEGGKTYRPWRWSNDKQTWVSSGPPAPSPLYHLNFVQSNDSAPVFVVEGEKCADALQDLLIANDNPAVVVSAWGGTGSIKNARWEVIAGRKVILWPDNDDVGRTAMAWVAQRLFSLRCHLTVIDVPRGTLPEHWDVADAIHAGWTYQQVREFVHSNAREVTKAPLEVVELSGAKPQEQAKPPAKQPRQRQAPPQDDGQTDAWRHWGLDCKASGIPWENTENVCRVLAKLNEGDAFGKIWYDEFAFRVATVGPGGIGSRAWEDADTIALQCYMQANLGMKRINKHLVHDAVIRHARSHTRNPVREWLKSLKWDGTERLSTMLNTGWGATQSDYTAAVGRCFLVGAVARVMQPGAKVDNMPVFEGPERGRKTLALETLTGSDWYDCPQYRITDRDFYLALRGKWIIELGEMSSMEGVTHTAIRAALSRRSDNYRAPFERHASDHPRMSVFATTTNSDNWHTDPHGAGRFWPVRCGAIDIDWISTNREQLFAEAMDRLDHFEHWWDVPELQAQEEREARRDPDSWEEPIRGFLIGKEWTTITDVLAGAIGLTSARDHTDNVTKRCGRVLRQLNWRRISKRVAGYEAPRKVWVHSPALERASLPHPLPSSDLDGF